jgi:outer membrane protein assembly factor BamB
MRTTFLRLAFLTVVLALAGCGGTDQGSAPPSAIIPSSILSNVYVTTNPQSASPQNTVYALSGAKGNVLWSYDNGAQANSPPVLANGLLYLGADTSVYALNAQNGAQVWRVPITGFAKVLGVENGSVYVGSFPSASNDASAEGIIYALNASSGKQLWRYKTAYGLVDALLLDGVIYATASQGDCQCVAPPTFTVALDASSGKRLWQTPTANDEYAVRLAANGVVYGLDSYPEGPVAILQAVNASDGSMRWRFPATPIASVSLIGMSGSAIYALSNDSNFVVNPTIIYALDAKTGAVRWRSEIKGATQPVITLIGKTLYLGSSDGSVTAINAANGKQVWHTRVGKAGPPIGSGTAVAAEANGRVYLSYPQGFAALNASDGSVQWKYEARGIVIISAVVDGVVYASSSDIDTTNQGHNTIYALNASTGALIWKYATQTAFFAPIVG